MAYLSDSCTASQRLQIALFDNGPQPPCRPAPAELWPLGGTRDALSDVRMTGNPRIAALLFFLAGMMFVVVYFMAGRVLNLAVAALLFVAAGLWAFGNRGAGR